MPDALWLHFPFRSTLEVHSLTKGQSAHAPFLPFVRTERTKQYTRMPTKTNAKSTKNNETTACNITSREIQRKFTTFPLNSQTRIKIYIAKETHATDRLMYPNAVPHAV